MPRVPTGIKRQPDIALHEVEKYVRRVDVSTEGQVQVISR
jgi:hypothetical protein